MDKNYFVSLPRHMSTNRGTGKIKLLEFLTAVFGKDEINAEFGFCSTETDIGNSFFGLTIEGYENECSQVYSIKNYCEALTAFEEIVAKKIKQVYRVDIGAQRNLLRIMEMIDGSKIH